MAIDSNVSIDVMAERHHALARRLRLISRVAVLVMVPVVFYFTSRGTWDPRHQINDGGWSAAFFMSQANAMLHARLDVPDGDLHAECFRRDNRCYGYFGITPSVLRIPVMGILRWFRSAFTPLYMAVALLLAYWAALRLLERSLCASTAPDRPPHLVLGYAILGAAALGPGGTLLLVTRPAVFEEAITWSLAFVLLALNWVWAWVARERSSLVPAVLFGIAAANARPTAALACGVLGLVVAALWYRSRRTERHVLAAALCLSLLPGLTVGAVFWLKLRTPMPSPLLNEQIQAAPHWRDILRINGQRTMSFVFTPTELVAYFRPDAVTRRPDWPIFDFRFPPEPILWVPPLRENGVYFERVTSLTTTMPLPWIVNLIALGWLASVGWAAITGHDTRASRRPAAPTRDQLLLAAGSLASAGAMILLVITTLGITNRYLSDFYATSVVGFAIGHHAILPFLARRPAAAIFAGLVGLGLVSWSVVVTLSLACVLVFY